MLPFGPAVWPAIANIHANIYKQRALLYIHIHSEPHEPEEYAHYT